MLKNIYNILKNLKISGNINKFIKFNKNKWKIDYNQNNGVILIDLFDWYPLIYFWSYVANFLSRKDKLKINFFYFPIYKSRISGNIRYRVLKKIYNSFNCTIGIKYKKIIDKEDYKKYSKLLEQIKNPEQLIQFKRNEILFGDLIYDSYLRSENLAYINNLNEKKFLNFFVRANIIFDQLTNYFEKNKVRYVVSSHATYLEYGLASRFGDKFGSVVFKVHDKGMATSNFGLKIMEKGKILQDFPYYEYQETFLKLNNQEKENGLKIGKEIIENRLKGKVDFSTSYMKKSAYSYQKQKNIFNEQKKKIVLFAHCFFDEPHRYRSIIFRDFYEFITKTIEYLKHNEDYILYIKPHPNGLPGNSYFFDEIKNTHKNNNKIVFIDPNTSNLDIISQKPDICLTVHGTIAHELAYNELLVINTGDNPHINYNFSLTAKSKDEYFEMLNNIEKHKKKINFDKKKIYEFLYMHYHHYMFYKMKKELLNDEYFTNNSFHIDGNLIHAKTNDDNLLNFYVQNDKKVNYDIIKYIENFFTKNNL